MNTNQAIYPPIEDLALIETHKRLIEASTNWSDIGILIDENHHSTLILMLQNDNVISLLRFCLSVDDSVSAVKSLMGADGKIYFGCFQGSEFTKEKIQSIDSINGIWSNIPEQIVEFSLNDVRDFFGRVEEEANKIGRGSHFTTETKRKVMQNSYGRCMFEGCGEDLGFDELTGHEGNFSYLAHNVASSENGPRGIIELSEKLSDDPKNILLLCDKHHRLIDKVATVDYPASRLSEMRRDFCSIAKNLLEGLSYQPIPAFSVLWPVHRQTISSPSSIQVAQCLSTSKYRLHSNINVVADNEAILRETDPKLIKEIMLHSINTSAEKILMQIQSAKYRGALFAFGLMPHLIALGAKLGNKNEITPMLRFRDSGQWIWPLAKPVGCFYTVTGIENLSANEKDIVIKLSLTNDTESMDSAYETIKKETNAKLISITALPEMMGNGALAHPDDGYIFTQEIQKLLHVLKDKHHVERVHLLPCASNAACVFFGQAFDSHHPDILIYDFQNKTMVKEILITNKQNKCSLSLITESVINSHS